MRLHRNMIANLLLATMVVGGMLAPLSHLAWMELVMPTPAESGMMHHGGMHAGMVMEGVSQTEDCADECPYLELLMNLSAGSLDVDAPTLADAPRLRTLGTPLETRAHEAVSQFDARGPPVA